MLSSLPALPLTTLPVATAVADLGGYNGCQDYQDGANIVSRGAGFGAWRPDPTTLGQGAGAHDVCGIRPVAAGGDVDSDSGGC